MANLKHETEFSMGGLLRLINPLSQITSAYGKEDWMPQQLLNMGRSAFPVPNADDVTHTLTKATTAGLGAAGLIYALRRAAHYSNMEQVMAGKSPGKDLEKVMSSTFRAPLSESEPEPQPSLIDKAKALWAPAPAVADKNKARKNVQTAKQAMIKRALGGTGAVATTIPVLTALLAAAASYNYADKKSDADLGGALDKQINTNTVMANKLMMARARQSRGLLSTRQYNKIMKQVNPSYQGIDEAEPEDLAKTAAFDSLKASIGLIATAIMLGTAGASYGYFRDNDPATIKHKAIRKGLETYGKEKVIHDKVDSMPVDSSVFKELNKNLVPAANRPRQSMEPQITQGSGRPISITI